MKFFEDMKRECRHGTLAINCNVCEEAADKAVEAELAKEEA